MTKSLHSFREMVEKATILLCLAVVLASSPVFAQSTGGQQGSGAQNKDTITFTARRMESVIAKGKEKTILIGSAVVNTGTIQVTADRIELAGKDYNDMLCIGNVMVKDESKGFQLTATNVAYTRDTEVGIAQNQVQIDDSKNNLLLKAEWVQFDQKQSILVARIAVHILKEDFAVRAEYARYDRNDESLQLSGSPVALNSDGKLGAEYMSGKADLNNLSMSGDVSGTITTTKKEETTNGTTNGTTNEATNGATETPAPELQNGTPPAGTPSEGVTSEGATKGTSP